jgi:hypothetical protein
MAEHQKVFYNQKVNNWSNNTDYYYIHLHKAHIGLMGNGTAQTGSDIANKFKNFRTKKDNQSYSMTSQAIKNQYLQLLAKNLKNNKVAKMSGLAAQISKEGITDYNLHLAEQMSKELEKKIKEILEASPIQVNDLLTIENKIKNISLLNNKNATKQQLETDLKWFDDYLEILSEGVALLGGVKNPQNNKIKDPVIQNFYLLLQNFNTGGSDISTLGTKLGNELQTKIIDVYGESKIVSAKQVVALASEIKKLTDKMTKIDTLEKPAEAFKGIIDKHTFAMGLGETLYGSMIRYGVNNLEEELQKEMTKNFAPNRIHFTGEDTFGIGVTNCEGTFENKDITGSQGQQGKMDVQMQNCSFSIEDLYGKEIHICMDVGISVKTYRDAQLKKGGFSDQKFKTGGGIDVGHTIQYLTDNSYIRYLGFNAVARRYDPDFSQAYEEIKKNVFLRSIVYVAGSRNQKDFATFMFVNGVLVSLWDIINYVIQKIEINKNNPNDNNYNDLEGFSFQISDEGDKKSTFHTKGVQIEPSEQEADRFEIYDRVGKINSDIYQMTVKGYIKPITVLKYFGKTP